MRGRASTDQIEILEAKAARLTTMIEEARARRTHLDAHLAELDGGPGPASRTEEARPYRSGGG